MAHDIKKRSASHIYFGVHSKSGEIMHISKVPSGQKCNCVCAACGQPFEARKLLSTGADCKMTKLIVLDEWINSMTEFKQIIGRGTKSSAKRTPPSSSKVPIILLMRKSAMKCGRWQMRYRSTSPIRGSGCGSLMSVSTSSVESHRSILQSKSTPLSPKSAINGAVFRLKRHSLLSRILCPPMGLSVFCRTTT